MNDVRVAGAAAARIPGHQVGCLPDHRPAVNPDRSSELIREVRVRRISAGPCHRARPFFLHGDRRLVGASHVVIDDPISRASKNERMRSCAAHAPMRSFINHARRR